MIQRMINLFRNLRKKRRLGRVRIKSKVFNSVEEAEENV